MQELRIYQMRVIAGDHEEVNAGRRSQWQPSILT